METVKGFQRWWRKLGETLAQSVEVHPGFWEIVLWLGTILITSSIVIYLWS